MVWDGLMESWGSRPPGTAVRTGLTLGMEGLVRSVRAEGVLEGLMEQLDSSDGGPEGEPPGRVDPSDTLSMPPLSWRSRFRLNLARAF